MHRDVSNKLSMYVGLIDTYIYIRVCVYLFYRKYSHKKQCTISYKLLVD